LFQLLTQYFSLQQIYRTYQQKLLYDLPNIFRPPLIQSLASPLAAIGHYTPAGGTVALLPPFQMLEGPIDLRKRNLFINLDGYKVYIKIVPFIDIYNFVVYFFILNHLEAQIIDTMFLSLNITS
jgi:hypothetical protein